MNTLIKKCRSLLQAQYEDRFAGLLLYGSQARGDAGPGSDLDLLVLLNGPFDYFEELHTIIDLLYSLQLESTYLISARPAGTDEFEDGSLQLYRNAKREGVLV